MQRSKEFRVSAPGMPTDTIIGYFLGGFGGLFIIISIIKSILTQGKSPKGVRSFDGERSDNGVYRDCFLCYRIQS